MKEIRFIQYILPNGREKEMYIDRPDDIAESAQKFIDNGGQFEVEILRTGEISLTAVKDGEEIAGELVSNGPDVLTAVDRLIDTVNKS